MGYDYNVTYQYRDPKRPLSQNIKIALEKLSNLYGYSINWLITGEGKRFAEGKNIVEKIKEKYGAYTQEAVIVSHEDKLTELEGRISKIESKLTSLESQIQGFVDLIVKRISK